MIKEEAYHVCVCDNCKVQYHCENSGICAMHFGSDIRDMASNDEWHNEDEKDYCPNCYTIDDEDKLIIKTENFKQ